MRRYLPGIFLGIITLAVFYPWFGPGVLAYGDWVHNLPLRLKEYYDHWLIWDGSVQLGTSLGTSAPNNIVLYPLAWLMSVMQEWLHISSSISTRLFWYFPYIIFSLSGAWYLGWVVSKRRLAATISSFVYTFSTFGLLTIQGGQMTIGNAYALAPFVLALAIQVRRNSGYQYVWWLSLVLWIQAIYDVRIAYLTSLTTVLYIVVSVLWNSDDSKSGFLKRYFVSLMTTLLLSAYWIIPMFLTNSIGSSGLPTAENSAHWLPVLSYAELSNAVTANHVWWPWSVGELHNIQPLFVLLLLLGVFGLMRLKQQKAVMGLAVVWIVGIFLTKGVNDPLGGAYKWLFVNFPGFSFFRDPAKFFVMIMLGLAPLVGLGVVNLWSVTRPKLRSFILVIVTLLLVWPLSDLVFTPRQGTFKPNQIPVFSSELQSWYDQNDGGRTFWVPRTQRYIVPTQKTPVVDASKMVEGEWASLATINQIEFDPYESLLNHSYADWLFDRVGVKYVGVPKDTDNEIFPHYRPRPEYVNHINRLSWLRPVGDEPEELDLYRNEDVLPAIYTAGAVVAVDKEVLGTDIDLPGLEANDALFIIDDQSQTEDVSNERTKVISLRKTTAQWQENYGEWSFFISQNFAGLITFDNSFAGRPLLLDGNSVADQSKIALKAGWHTLRFEDGVLESLLPTNLADLDWQTCLAGQETTTLSLNETGSLTTGSPLWHLPSCVETAIGPVSPGVYLLQSVFTSQPNTLARLQVNYDLASQADLIGQDVVGAQSTAVVFISSLTKDGKLKVIAEPDPLASGDLSNGLGVTVTSLSLKKLFARPPVWLRLDSAEQPTLSPAVTDIVQLSPRHYQATVSQSDTPYYIILNQAYASAWQVSGVEVLEHHRVNGGLNAWLIKPTENTSIKITYASYTPYWLGVIITLLTVGFVKWRLIFNKKRPTT